jgi:hypothetical protein
MNAKHTPGQVKLTEEAGIRRPRSGHSARRRLQAEEARLIAAAPDMLTALKTFVEGEFILADAVNAARAALAKAKGE